MTNESLLWKYQERSGEPGFWGEPVNAFSNLAFVVAAVLAWRLASKKEVKSQSVGLLTLLAMLVALGSFVFHTLPNHLTLWLDILPILIFQICFIWNFCRKVAQLGPWWTVLILILVIGSALVLRPIRQPMNGSLFYFPPLLALLIFGWIWAETSKPEPWSLFAAATFFSLAVIARSIDWEVEMRIGTHFLWHIMNGVVVYLLIRTAIVFEAHNQSSTN